MHERIILFDGVCNFCNNWIDFVVRRDPKGKFKFAALQSDSGKRLLAERGLSADGLTTVFLLDGERVHARSGAALRIAAGLGGAWPLVSVFLIVPPFIRNAVYDWIARNRYRWFGKRDTCRVPGPGERSRFL